MSPLERALIEKAGHDNGFEHVLDGSPAEVRMGSALHPARVIVATLPRGWRLGFESTSRSSLFDELRRSWPELYLGGHDFKASDRDHLALLLRRAAALARALPRQAEQDYEQAVNTELRRLPVAALGTEIERLVRQRVGQDVFRAALLYYWGGACAVTGVAVKEVLRASHAKPWAECATDAERLDVFNGLLLTANLDALFDRYLISFDSEGGMLVSPLLPLTELAKLGLDPRPRLRWVAEAHQGYLRYHRERSEVLTAQRTTSERSE